MVKKEEDMNVVEKMHRMYSTMTDTDRRIYHRILNNSTSFSLKPIGEIASELKISQTSLMRFAKRLGFEGYAQFKKKLQEEEILSSTPAERMQRLKASKYRSSPSLLIDQECKNISEAIENTNLEQISHLVETLMGNCRVFCVGVKEERYLAELLCYRLRFFNINVTFLPTELVEYRELIYRSDFPVVLIVFDFFPYSKAVNHLSAYASERGAYVVAISDQPGNPMQKCSDCVFFCPSKTDYFMNSTSASIAWINFLCSELFEKNEDIVEILEVRENIRRQSGDYFFI